MKLTKILLFSVLTLQLGCATVSDRGPEDALGRKIASKASVKVPSFDGFPLPVFIELPDGTSESSIERVIIVAHGSGPHNADGDLSAISLPAGAQNLIYRDLAAAIRSKGFATVRYNKRAFEARERLQRDSEYANSAEFKRYAERPLQYFLDDLKHMAKRTRSMFPRAKVYILGHSEGANLALWAASDLPFVSGVALFGFANEKQSSLIYEQFVYRSYFGFFRQLDKNGDLKINGTELSANTDLANALRKQLDTLDLNRDGIIDLSEYNAGSYSTALLLPSLYDRGYQITEASLPRPSEVIQSARFKVLFLQGELDNQTPSFHAKAVEIANRAKWKNENLRFRYFPGKGHALDPRTSMADANYRKIEPGTLQEVAKEVDGFFN